MKTFGAYPLDPSAGEIKPFDPSAAGSFSDFAAKFGTRDRETGRDSVIPRRLDGHRQSMAGVHQLRAGSY